MDIFTPEQTKSTPWIHFDPQDNHLQIKGESYPENSASFYTPMMEWLEEYLNNVSNSSIRVDVQLVYFNSSSSKVFMNLFDRLEESARKGIHVEINWMYHEDNDTALECGEEFQEDLENVEFNLLPIEE
ncbi:hypothetical protein AKJ60_00170 [candidate division MSBL1 archaeon SCGC-AAA385M11]|nr:hypothetical protein AKJ60_00170 [candidate division MSBL1 archaeon SCGC-AAA385M11]